MSYQPQPNTPGPHEPPPSPWLRKYGGQARNVAKYTNNFTHSGLAPFLPSLDPAFYAEDNRTHSDISPYTRPSDHHLDLLFGTEKAQLDINGGLKTWEAGILGEYLVNGWPGGHRKSDHRESGSPMADPLEHGYGVHVDETSWHPIFAKNKWYDLRLPIVDGKFIRNPPLNIDPADVWSVDVPRVWSELRVSVELANRWLRHMVNSTWLKNMIHEDWEEWMEAKPNKADLDQDPTQLGPNDRPARIPAKNKKYDSKKTLQHIADMLSPKLIWTFVDDGYHPFSKADEGDYYGRTIHHWDGGEEPTDGNPGGVEPFFAIYIHVHPIRVLLGKNSTLSERYHARWSLAMTMLHELMHAINLARNPYTFGYQPEPYYDKEWSRELGSSGINSFFGGDIIETPAIDTPGKSGYKYGMCSTSWPAAPGNDPPQSINNNPVFHLGHIDTASPLPSAWSSAMLLESFYTGAAQKYGLAAFQAPQLFLSNRIYRGFYTEAHAARTAPTVLTATHAALHPEITRTLAALDARRLLWSQLRPWYDRERAVWDQSPHSNVAARAILARFADAVAQYRLARGNWNAEMQAEGEAAAALSGMFYWTSVYRLGPGDAARPRGDWIFHVLSLMMMAVLPARKKAGYDHSFEMIKNTWLPSNAALQAGNGKWRFEEERQVWAGPQRGFTLQARHWRDPVRDEDGDIVDSVDSRTLRIELLQRASHVLRHRVVLEPVTVELVQALEMELDSLFSQVVNGYGGDEDDEWLSWRFEFPEYTSKLVTKDASGRFIPWPQLTPGPGGPAQGGPGVGHGHVQANPTQVGGARRRGTRQPPKYFTVSEIGDMRLSADKRDERPRWVLVRDDEGGQDVYDVTGLLDEDGRFDDGTSVEWTEQGPEINSQKTVDHLKAKGRRPFGKLLKWKHHEEVAERDGKDGRDLWSVVGQFIYDITHFPFDSEHEKQAVIALSSTNKGQYKAVFDMSRLLERLAPYRCGFLRQNAPPAPPRQRIFTMREIGRHIYPEIGMYCAIDGDVYDIGRYLHSHPGGARLLEMFAGRDATDEFYDFHRDWATTLKAYSIIKVGRVVEERLIGSDIDEDEIIIQNRVYRYSSLPRNNDFLHDKLFFYGGTDATTHLRGAQTPAALRYLISRDDLMCAKLVNDPMQRKITVEELEKHNRVPSKEEWREKPISWGGEWRVWVSVAAERNPRKQMVYDVTSMVMFGDDDFSREVRLWLGEQVLDSELADTFRSRYESFIIGELVGGGKRVEGRWKPTRGPRYPIRPGSLDSVGLKRQSRDLDDIDEKVAGPSKNLRVI